jgi:hypothetical protein
MFSVKVSQADYISEGGSGQYIKIDAVPKGQRGSKQVVQAMRQVQRRWLRVLESCLPSNIFVNHWWVKVEDRKV